MRVTKSLDWKIIRAFHDSISGKEDDSGTLTAEKTQYKRARKFVREYHRGHDWQASWDALLKLGERFCLTLSGAAKLYVALQREFRRYELNAELEAFLAAGDFLDDLERARKPLLALANWSEGMLAEDRPARLNIAATHLENAAYAWAQRIEANPPQKAMLRFRGVFDNISVEGQTVDCGQAAVIKNWLIGNILIRQILESAVSNEYHRRQTDKRERKEWDAALAMTKATSASEMPKKPVEYMTRPENSAINVLRGITLPRLYTRFTGRKFGLSKGMAPLRDTTGVLFVRLAMAVIGLNPSSPHTVRDSWEAATKGKRKRARKKKRRSKAAQSPLVKAPV